MFVSLLRATHALVEGAVGGGVVAIPMSGVLLLCISCDVCHPNVCTLNNSLALEVGELKI